MTTTRRLLVALLLLLALAAPQIVATSNALAGPEGEDGYHGRDYRPIEEGLEPGDEGEEVGDLQSYLDRYGYFNQRQYSYQRFDRATEDALKEFQSIYKLSQTGRVDRSTAELLNAPRFDDRPDVAANGDPQVGEYVLYGTSWDDPNLTYAFNRYTSDLSQSAQKSALEAALATWAAVTPLTFTEVSMSQSPDIVISFESGNHGDGNNFDGPSGVLAHAYYPPNIDPIGTSLHGDAHFDDSETWTVTIPVPGGGIDLQTVAIHEFGHSLGLAHSNNQNAIMYAYYGGANRTLTSDDTSAIQQLYGADTGGGGTVVDAEVLSLSMSPSSTIVGNAVTGTVQVRNNGDQSAVIPVTVSGPGNFSYNANTSNVAAGQSTSVTFQWTPASAGNYTLTATANLSGDGNGSNNSKTSNTVSVQNPTQTIDAQVVSASASPTSITQNSGNVTVSAQIRNNGTASATIPVTVNGPDNWSNSTSRTLASGASTTIQFSWPASATGSHTFTVSTALSGDSNAGNNSQTTNSVTVSSPTPTTSLYVASVDMSATPYGNGYTLRAVVTVGPNAGAASGAYMYGYWISPTNRYRVGYGYLNSSGQITLQTTTNETGVHRFHVYNVIKSGTPYDSSKNVGNPGTVDVGGGGSTPTIDASVNNVTANPTSIALNGGNVTITATVGNNGDNAASVPVSVSGPSGFSDAKSVSVGAGSTQQVTFSWPASVAGSHTFTVSTNLSGDSNSGNNQRTSPTVSVTQASIVDAEVTTLTRSASSVEQNSQPVTFTASVRNNGTSSANFTVRLASSSASVNQTQQVTVASGASQNVQFQWSPSIVGNHSFTATAELSGDSNSSNNSKSVNLSVTSPPPPPPPGGEQVFVGRIYTIKVGSSWYIYTWVDSTDDGVRYGATITATIRAQSGQTKQLTGRTNYGGYALMYTGPVGSGSHTYSVTDITYDGYSYNPSLNVTTAANLPN